MSKFTKSVFKIVKVILTEEKVLVASTWGGFHELIYSLRQALTLSSYALRKTFTPKKLLKSLV